MLFVACAAGCSSGPAQVRSELRLEEGVLRIEVTTEGPNVFRAAGQHCEALASGSCTLTIPLADLGSGWVEIPIAGQRRIGGEGPPVVRQHLGDQAFPRECEVQEEGGLGEGSELVLDLRCKAPDGYHLSLGGEPMQGGRARIPARTLIDLSDPSLPGAPPLVRRDLDVVVHNRAGASRPRPFPVALPLPLVQLAVEGWADPWFEDEMPVSIHVEPGAELLIDGKAIPVPAGADRVAHTFSVQVGRNEFVVEARLPGRVPTRVVMAVLGEAPKSPLYIDSPRSLKFTTTDPMLHLRGHTHPKARVFVDRVPIDVGADGRWSWDAPLEEGENEVAVVADLGGRPGQPGRPWTTRIFEVRLDPLPNQYVRREDGTDQEALSFSDALGPTEPPAGTRLSFPFVVEEVQRSPSLTGCRARLVGRACTRAQEHEVRIGWERHDAWTCLGDRSPAIVDLPDCPDIDPGSWLDVDGTWEMVLGGRSADRTVARPVINGRTARPRPLWNSREAGP